MNLPYVVPRVVRHFLPESLTRFLLTRSLIIRPGLETADPQAAVARYLQVLAERGRSLVDRRVLVFGYGGRFDIGVQLLEAGAGHVVLCDRFAVPDDVRNRALLPRFDSYLKVEAGHVTPRPGRMTLIQRDINEVQESRVLEPVDLVVSTSVYEHLTDVDGNTRALAALTRADGLQIHYVDLRDHFFKYPFEMLTYSEATWRLWLNPTSNHNRYRVWDYRRVFEAYFGKVEIQILERDERGFLTAENRIRAEFKCGNIQDDSVTLIQVVAQSPRPQGAP